MKHIKRRTLPLLLALTLLLGTGAALASGGGKSDPLVTLSYLTDIALPDLLDDLSDLTELIGDKLRDDLADQIDEYEEEMQALVSAADTAGTSGSETYTLVTLTDGQTLAPEVGCELMLRVGSISVTAATSPALIDMTTGDTINSGTSLTKNHLYMATIPDRVLGPVSGTVKLLARGSFTVAGPVG